jgi:phage gp45-like
MFIGKEKIDVEAKGIPVKVFNDKGSIEITKDGNITIKGKTITLDAQTDIILKSKDLKSDTKVHTTVTAGGEVKISGRLGGTLDGGLTTKIKGAMVNIN